MTVKRGLDQENQPRSKRTRQDFSKKTPTGESTESSEGEEGEDSETGSQASGTSHTTGTAPATPTSGKEVIEGERERPILNHSLSCILFVQVYTIKRVEFFLNRSMLNNLLDMF